MAIEVRKLPIDPGPSGWNAILPLEPERPALAGSVAADWLVIGAGFAGLAAARRLRQRAPSDRILVLDATRVAHGPAGRNSGFMIDLPHDLASGDYGGGGLEADRRRMRLTRAAIDFAGDAAREYGLGPEVFARSGKINAAATAKGLAHNATYSKHLAALDESHEMLDAEAMQALTGIDYYAGGLFTPGAAMIQPAAFMRGVARGLESGLTTIFEMSPVVGLERHGPLWVARTPGGTVAAARVILAVNGHVESFGFFRRRLMHVFTYASMTRPLTPPQVAALGGAATWSCTPADPMGTTVRRISGQGGDRIVVRNRFTYDPSMQVSQARITAVARDHDRAFRARFPMLSGVEMAYRWGGRLCLSRNGAPAFGQLDEGLYSACCQNGLGTAKGTLAGMMAADLATGATSDLLDQMLAEPAPTLLPPAPIDRIGASAVIRWNEWRAGGEL